MNGDEFPEVGPETSSSNEVATAPEHIGPYRLLEKLGEGGMGVVYLAEQEEPIVREVALKVVRAGLDSQTVLARFESERQALSLMDHPNIAKVLDAGSTSDGRPYFVMEVVHGPPITEYCDREGADIRTRLELYLQVCAALQHAHQKGIIHRDVKPSNVLVECRDGRAIPKVIDFGVAKAIDRQLTEKTLFTEHGVFIGTPEYTSPEQADIGAVDVDTRADVYSLGVLLYELLVGHPPFDHAALRSAGYDAMRRLIRETDPPTPSRRLRGLGEAAGEVAAQRQTDTRSLTRQLRDDLDWITIKALEKDRGRRYPSVADLAADVQRHLDHEPIAARPPNGAYRLKKFLRRNRGALPLILALLAGLAVALFLIDRWRDAREELVHAALEKQIMEEKWLTLLAGDAKTYEELDVPWIMWGVESPSPEATALFQTIISYYLLRPLHKQPGFLWGENDALWDIRKVNQAIDRDDPSALLCLILLVDYLSEVKVSHTTGEEFEREFNRLCRRGLVLARENLIRIEGGQEPGQYEGYSHGPSREVLIQFLDRWRARYENADPDEVAELVLDEAVTRLRQLRREHDSQTLVKGLRASIIKLANVLERRATNLARSRKWAEAVDRLRSAISLHREVGVHSWEEARLESALGGCLLELGKFEEAEPLLLRSYHAMRESHGRRNALTQVALNRIITMYHSQNEGEKEGRYLAERSRVPLVSVREVGTLRIPPSNTPPRGRQRDGGYSVFLRNRGIWRFGDDWLRTNDRDPRDGLEGFAQCSVDEAPILILGAEMRRFNHAHRHTACGDTCGQYLLRLGAVVPDSAHKRAIMHYSIIFRPNKDKNGDARRDSLLGSSLVVRSWDERDTFGHVVEKGATNSQDYMFTSSEPVWGSAAVVVDSLLYTYSCDCTITDCPCLLAKVPLSMTEERDAWRFYGNSGRWNIDWRHADPVLIGMHMPGTTTRPWLPEGSAWKKGLIAHAPLFSVQWNEHLGMFVAIGTQTNERQLYIALGDRPEGPWTEEFTIDLRTPLWRLYWITSHESEWSPSVFGHPELDQEGGRYLYVTYSFIVKPRHTREFWGDTTWLIELGFR